MKKCIALFLSLLMLGSQIGFALSTHYCGGKVSGVAISLVEEKVSCGMEAMQEACASMADGISEQSCCDDKSHIIQLDEDFQKNQRFSNIETEFLAVFAVHYFLLFDQPLKAKEYTKPPLPPLIQQDIQVLHQSFLI